MLCVGTILKLSNFILQQLLDKSSGNRNNDNATANNRPCV